MKWICFPLLVQADYYSCIATIVFLRKENCLYQACPSQDCNKKVLDQQNGMFRCEKCDKEFPNFKYRLILSVSDLKPGAHFAPIYFFFSPPHSLLFSSWGFFFFLRFKFFFLFLNTLSFYILKPVLLSLWPLSPSHNVASNCSPQLKLEMLKLHLWNAVMRTRFNLTWGFLSFVFDRCRSLYIPLSCCIFTDEHKYNFSQLG